MKFKDLNLLEVGSSIGLVGVIFADDYWSYLCMLPDQKAPNSGQIEDLEMTLEEWKTFLRQLDFQETEILTKAPNGDIVKALVRKTQRTIEQRVSWAVFKRDGYHCRYCGRDGLPLTVDHLVLWEEGGPSIEENLVAACRKCNSTRGRTQYAEWLKSSYYEEVSRNLPIAIVDKNDALVATLDKIPRRYSQRETRK